MPPHPRLPLLAALFTIVFWSFAFPASKAALPYFAVEQVVLLRYLAASGLYLLLFACGRFPLPGKRDLPAIILLSLLGVTLYQLCFVFGVGKVSVAAAAMIIATIPVFASLLAWLFLDEKLSRPAWAGILICLSGVALIMLVKPTGGTLQGYLILFVAVASITIFFVFQKPFFARYSPLAMTSYTSFFGVLPLLYLLPDTIAAGLLAPGEVLLSIFAMGILSSGLGFFLWFYALAHLPAGVVTSFLFLQPVLAGIMAWLWLAEVPSLQTLLGGAVVLLGVALIVKQQVAAKGGN